MYDFAVVLPFLLTMILTRCPACAAPLPERTAKQCSRCKTRYCGAACQKKHWEEGGHDGLCRRIKRGGGAEKYHADKKYREAVAAAVEKCAEDTKGQTCYICLEAVHPRTGEGLVRGCACGDRDGVASGRTGIAHVSCLVEQAKILFAEAEENNLDNKVKGERLRRWSTCSLCEQDYHGVVACALGWASWKTYMGRPETDWARCRAMTVLGTGLAAVENYEDALSVQEADLAMMRRLGGSQEDILFVQGNLACTYYRLGRRREALRIERDVYSGYLKSYGEEHERTLVAAINFTTSLIYQNRFEEAKSLLLKTIPVARRVLGESHGLTLKMRANYAEALYTDPDSTLDNLRESVTTLAEIEPIARRVLGDAHPTTTDVEGNLLDARIALRARWGPV